MASPNPVNPSTDTIMRKLRERRAGGRTSADDGTDAGRTGSERPDDYGTEQAAKQIADLEREIEQRKQSREYRSIADKIKANRGTINQRDRQQEKSRRRSCGISIMQNLYFILFLILKL